MSWDPEGGELGSDPPVGAQPPPGTYARRTARRDGREVARLRCVRAAGTFAVECEVFPAHTMRVAPLLPGPYRFTTLDGATAFLWEATRALEYLGCSVTDPDAEAEASAEAA